MILEVLKEHKEGRLRRLTDDRCEKFVLRILEDAHERTKENFYMFVFEVTGQIAIKTFLTAGADELLDDKMYKLAES